MFEKREYIRLNYDRHVNLEFISDSYDRCQINNLSLSGMFIKGDYTQLMGKCCRVNLVQKGLSTDLSLLAQAKVVRKNADGIAIEFTSMPLDSYMFLNILLLSEADNSLISDKLLAENCPFEVTDDLLTCLD